MATAASAPDPVATLQETVGRHGTILERLDREMGEVRTELKPKPSDWLKIAGVITPVVILLLTAWWRLSAMMSERPTRGELERALSQTAAEVAADRAKTQVLLEAQGSEVKTIREAQIEQGTSLKYMQSLAEKTSERLERIIDQKRTP